MLFRDTCYFATPLQLNLTIHSSLNRLLRYNLIIDSSLRSLLYSSHALTFFNKSLTRASRALSSMTSTVCATRLFADRESSTSPSPLLPSMLSNL